MVNPTKTMREREKELQLQLQTPKGSAELEDLAGRYAELPASPRRNGPSVITFILICEREQGLILG
jgi:hypothetical protein